MRYLKRRIAWFALLYIVQNLVRQSVFWLHGCKIFQLTLTNKIANTWNYRAAGIYIFFLKIGLDWYTKGNHMRKKLLFIVSCSFLFSSQCLAQPASEVVEMKNVVADLLAKKATPCDWLAEVKRTNTWFERDQAGRAEVGMLYKAANGKSIDKAKIEEISVRVQANDKVLQGELDDLVRRCGWPTTSGFGKNAPQSATMIIIHADLDYQLKYFPVMKAAVAMGELAEREVADIEDRIRMRQNKPQIYGSQLVSGKNPGEMALWPIEDEAHVDERRAQVGMIPASICAYISMFTPPVKYERCK